MSFFSAWDNKDIDQRYKKTQKNTKNENKSKKDSKSQENFDDPRDPITLPQEILEAKSLDFDIVEKYLLEVIKKNKVCVSVGRLLKEWLELKMEKQKSGEDEINEFDIEKLLNSIKEE